MFFVQLGSPWPEAPLPFGAVAPEVIRGGLLAMRLTRFAFAKAIIVVSLTLGFLTIFGFQHIAPSLEAPMAATAAAALPPDPAVIGQWSSLMPMNGVVAIHTAACSLAEFTISSTVMASRTQISSILIPIPGFVWPT